MVPARQLRRTERGHGRVFRAFVAVLLWPFYHLPSFGRTGVIYPRDIVHLTNVCDIPGDKSPEHAKRWANGTMAPARQLRRTERGHSRVFRAFVAVLLWPFYHLPTFGRTGVIYPPGCRALGDVRDIPGDKSPSYAKR